MEQFILTINTLAEKNGDEFVLWLCVITIVCILLVIDRVLPN